MPDSEGPKFELVIQRVVDHERKMILVVNSRAERDYLILGYDRRIEV